MEALTLLVPAVATVALGGALLVPIRDARAGRKATLDGRSPLLADFRKLALVDGNDRKDDATREESLEAHTDSPPKATLVSDAARDVDPISVFRNLTRRRRATQPVPEAESTIVAERSFADELASLLPLVTTETVSAPLPSSATIQSHAATPFDPGQSSVEPPDAQMQTCETLAVPLAPVRSGRVVPLTRLPLRHQSTEVTWPGLTSPPRTFATLAERYAFLQSDARELNLADDSVFALAFREETPEGRILALAALRRPDASKAAIDTFAEALGTGSDEERAFAIDALSEAGARDDIARGITDRIDAIAAKAALAYVGTTARGDYRAALYPLVDEKRIETILALLAGVVE